MWINKKQLPSKNLRKSMPVHMFRLNIVRFIALIAVLFLCTINVTALESNIDQYNIDSNFDEQLKASGADELIDNLPDETQGLLDSIGINEIEPGQVLDMSPGEIFSSIFDILKSRASAPLKACGAIAGIIIIYAIFDGLKLSIGERPLSTTFGAASAICAGMVIMIPVLQCFSEGLKTIESCHIFMTAYVPAFVAIMIAAGQPISSSIYSVLLFAASQGVSTIAHSLIMPLTTIFFAISMICAIVPSIDLTGISSSISKIATWTLSLSMTLYVGLLTIQGAVGSSADSLSLKTARYFAGSLVPVVGSAVGDAMASIFSSISMVKTSVGAIGIISCCAIFIPILLELLCYKAAFAICSGIGDVFNAKHISSILKAAGSAVGIMLAIIISYLMMIIISTAIMLMMKPA